MKNKLLKFTATGLIALSMSVSAQAAEKLNLTAGMGHPAVFLWVKHITETFIPTLKEELSKTGEVEIEWTEAYGGTLVKVGSEVDAFESGLTDLGMASGVFNPASLGILNVTYAMPFGSTDPELVTNAVEEALGNAEGLIDSLGDKTGMVYIGGGIAIDSYNIGTKNEMKSTADFNGVKIGGAGPNLAWIKPVGAVGVQGSYVTFYNDVKTGVYDGHIGWMTASVPSKQYEVTPYWNEVDFGAMYIGGLGVAKSRWDTFSDDTKAAFHTAAAAYSKAYFAEQAARYASAKETLLANGGKIVPLKPEERQKWIDDLENPVTAWREAALARGEPVDAILKDYSDYLAKNGFTFPRDYLSE